MIFKNPRQHFSETLRYTCYTVPVVHPHGSKTTLNWQLKLLLCQKWITITLIPCLVPPKINVVIRACLPDRVRILPPLTFRILQWKVLFLTRAQIWEWKSHRLRFSTPPPPPPQILSSGDGSWDRHSTLLREALITSRSPQMWMSVCCPCVRPSEFFVIFAKSIYEPGTASDPPSQNEHFRVSRPIWKYINVLLGSAHSDISSPDHDVKLESWKKRHSVITS